MPAEAVLTGADARFLTRRAGLTAAWRVVGPALIALLAVLVAWLLATSPRLINPLVIQAEIEAETASATTLTLMAAMLPLVVLVLLAVTALTVGLAFVAFANERRYLRIIRTLGGGG